MNQPFWFSLQQSHLTMLFAAQNQAFAWFYDRVSWGGGGTQTAPYDDKTPSILTCSRCKSKVELFNNFSFFRYRNSLYLPNRHYFGFMRYRMRFGQHFSHVPRAGGTLDSEGSRLSQTSSSMQLKAKLGEWSQNSLCSDKNEIHTSFYSAGDMIA